MPPIPPRQAAWFSRERLVLAGLLLFAVVVRGGVLWAMRDKLRDDPDAYREIAENLLQHGAFALGSGAPHAARDLEDLPQPTAFRPPLYPVLLSNLAARDGSHVSLAKVAALHLLLGVGTVWLTWLTARRLSANPQSAIRNPQWNGGPAPAAGWSHPTAMPLLAGVIVACDPILLNQSALVMTETLAAFLAVLALWCLARFDSQRSWFNAGLAGGAMGLAVLCRPTFLPWLLVVAAGMLLVRGRIAKCKVQNAKCKLGWDDVGWRVANCVAILVVAGVVVSPWVVRNQRVFGKPIVTTTHGGYTLWLGNNDFYYRWLREDNTGLPWSPPGRIAGLLIDDWVHLSSTWSSSLPSEFAEDRFFYNEARESIADNPLSFGRACFYRLGQFWSPLPNQLTAEESAGRRLLRYAVAAWYCGVYLLAAVGAWRLCSARVSDPAGAADRRSPGGAREGDLRSGAGAGSGDPRTTEDGLPAGGPVLPRSGGPHWRARWMWGALLCLVFTGVHTFYWSNLRMRAPLMPFVALVAAAGMWAAAPRQARRGNQRGGG